VRAENTLENRLFTSATDGKSRVMVLGGGGPYAAIIAGFLSPICEALGPTFFSEIYVVSGGGFSGTYYASNQTKIVQDTWRYLIDGFKLFNPFNPLNGLPILNLEYLTNLARNGTTRLDTEALLKGTTPTFALTDLKSGMPVYKKPQTEDEVFSLMEASSALPIRRPIRIDGTEYVDGTLSVGAYPIEKALEDRHEEILVISSRSNRFYNRSGLDLSAIPLSLLAAVNGEPVLSRLCREYRSRIKASNIVARNHPDRVELVEPKPDEQYLRHAFDFNKERLDATVISGIRLAEEWLRDHGY